MNKYALIGYPLSHSYSPFIHKEIFKSRRVDATYELLEISEDRLEEIVGYLRQGIYKGFNVTIPYKIKIIPYLDEISPEAMAIGSVNTITIKNGKVIGYNTDYYGFIEQLKHFNIDVRNKDVFVLGTGGASLSVSKALKDLGGIVSRVSRNPGEDTISYNDLNDRVKDSIIVNTTPVGMYPHVDQSPLSYEVAKQANTIVDIIFNPKITKLMSYNKNSFNGLPMLVFQAAKAQEIWFGDNKNIDYNKILEDVRGEVYE